MGPDFVTDPTTTDDLLARADVYADYHAAPSGTSELIVELAAEVRALRATVDQWADRWQEQHDRADHVGGAMSKDFGIAHQFGPIYERKHEFIPQTGSRVCVCGEMKDHPIHDRDGES
jgi:hypothetical protein